MSFTGRLENFGLERIVEDIRQHHWSGSLKLSFDQPAAKTAVYLLFGDGLLLTFHGAPERENLADELVGFEFITVDRMQLALQASHERQERIEKVLVEEGCFTEEALQAAYQRVITQRLQIFLERLTGEYVFNRVEGSSDDVAMPDLALPSDELYMAGGLDPTLLLEILVKAREAEVEAQFDRSNLELAGPEDEPVVTTTPFVPPTSFDAPLEPGPEVEIAIDLDNEIVGKLAQPHEIEQSFFVNWTEGLGVPPFNLEGSGDDLSFLNLMLQELHEPTSRVDVTLMLLRFASQIFQRGVLFKIEEDKLRSAGEFGFGAAEDHKAVEEIEALRLPLDRAGIFSEALREKRILKKTLTPGGGDEVFFGIFKTELPREAFIAPIFSRLDMKRPMAVFYGDQGPETPLSGKEVAVEIFLTQISLALERRFLQDQVEAIE